MRVSERVALMLREAVERVAERPEACARSPGRDFTRSRKLPLAELLWLLVTMGTDTLGMELLRWSQASASAPSAGALCQQWAKLAAGAPRLVLDEFLSMFRPRAFRGRWRLLLADGTDLRIAPDPSDPRTRMPPTRGADGHNEVHLTCAFDPIRRTFEDMAVRGGREKDEYAELCELVDRSGPGDGLRPLWVADRGFCSYNVLAHMALAGASYVIRAPDPRASAILGRDVSGEGELDEVAELCVVRTRSPAARTRPGEPWPCRRLSGSRTFDPLPPGSAGEFWMSPRVVRTRTPDGWLNLVTDLPAGEFGAADLAAVYRMRWDIETAFDELKHVIGLECPHARAPGRVAQEAWARLVLFDACSLGASGVEGPAPGRRHRRAVDRTVAFKLVMTLLRGTAVVVEAVCARHSQPVRPGRSFRRRRRPQAPPSFSRRH